MAGEFEFIDWLRKQTLQAESVLVPPGDDLAVLKWGWSDLVLVGVDQVLDQVHFDSSIHSPRQIGRKVMNRNLSDCAAMACIPAAAVCAAALPRGRGIDYARELYLGLREAGDALGCPLVGGDTGSWDGRLVVSVTVLGRSAGIKPITRSGARPQDAIYVTGPLGGSILGRHMDFVPRVQLARDLAGAWRVTAMIDLSDGLARDIAHLCRESGLGALLDGASIPIHDDAWRLADGDRTRALRHALTDGEDYELLLTSPDALEPYGAIRIGTMTATPEILLQGAAGRHPIEAGGWEHAL